MTADPPSLLAAVADALNMCERHGIIVDLDHGAALTTRGYVMAVGDPRLGHRWAVRTRLDPEAPTRVTGTAEVSPATQ